jgi:Ca2+-binding EF-hand superfamily protein
MLGERLTDLDVDNIFKYTQTEEDLDGNIKYEEFIKKVMAGPPEDKRK